MSGRRGLVDVLLRRWQLRLAEKLFGWALPLLALLLAVVSVLRAAVTYPRTTAALSAAGVLAWLLVAHRTATVSTAVGLYVGAYAWAWWWPASFRRCVGWRALAAWRSLWVYRRQWRAAMDAAELDRGGELPKLRRVRCLADVDVVHVRALIGQRGGQWEAAGPMLAVTFGARDVRVHRGDNRRLTLEFLRGPRGRSWNRDGRLELEGVRR